MDFHATTPMDPRVLKDMMPYLTNVYGNPSSIDHSYGHDAANIVQTSRETIASAIHAHMDEIIFTSGATESDNLALKGVMANKLLIRGNHLITCVTEHKAILRYCKISRVASELGSHIYQLMNLAVLILEQYLMP